MLKVAFEKNREITTQKHKFCSNCPFDSTYAANEKKNENKKPIKFSLLLNSISSSDLFTKKFDC